MSNFKDVLRATLLVAVGINSVMFAFGVSIGSSDLYLLALASGSLCLLGYTSNRPEDEDERK